MKHRFNIIDRSVYKDNIEPLPSDSEIDVSDIITYDRDIDVSAFMPYDNDSIKINSVGNISNIKSQGVRPSLPYQGIARRKLNQGSIRQKLNFSSFEYDEVIISSDGNVYGHHGESMLAKYLATPRGRQQLASAMAAPIKRNIDYQSAYQSIVVEPLPFDPEIDILIGDDDV